MRRRPGTRDGALEVARTRVDLFSTIDHSERINFDHGTPLSGAVPVSPAIPHRDWMKSSAAYRQLPALRKRVADLERRLVELEEKLKE